MVVPDGLSWEIVLVDNASTDATSSVVATHRGDLPIRYVMEPQQGLAHARNRGVAEASGEILLFTDDDVLVEPGWLTEHVKAARAHPEALAFGGPIEPWFEAEPPEWISRHLHLLEGVYAIRELGESIRTLRPGELPFGANVGFRACVFDDRSFDPKLGRTPDEMLSGEETALLWELQSRQPDSILWVGLARVRHFIPAERLTKGYVRSFYHGIGRTRVRMQSVFSGRTIAGIPRHLIREYATCLARAGLRSNKKDEDWFTAYRDAAICRGAIDEWLSLRRSAS
jgi:hypothetical protein